MDEFLKNLELCSDMFLTAVDMAREAYEKDNLTLGLAAYIFSCAACGQAWLVKTVAEKLDNLESIFFVTTPYNHTDTIQ